MRVRSGVPSIPAPPIPTGRPAEPRRTRAFATILGEGDAAARAAAPAPPATAVPSTAAPPTAAPPTAPAAASPVRAFLERTLTAEQRVDALLAAAARGKTFSPAELLALQATAFRYSQTVEIVSRATDKLIGAVKQTMSTQV
jgi:hypothetical protein